MTATSVLPYSFLTNTEKKMVRVLRFPQNICAIEHATVTLNTKEKVNPVWLHANRNQIQFSAGLYQQQVEQINPALFPFLSTEKKEALKHLLTLSLWSTYLQYRLDVLESRQYFLSDYTSRLKQSQDYLIALEQASLTANSPERMQAHVNSISSTAPRYLGIRAASIMTDLIAALKQLYQHNRKKFTQLIEAWKQGKTKLLIEWMSQLNELRLYWVWGGGLLDTIFIHLHQAGSINDQYFDHLEQYLQTPTPIMGNMSWMLYYARFFINLSLLLKHTIPHPWMSADERQIPWFQRLAYQWRSRKYQLLNDGIWASANLVNYFWLTYRASPKMGMYGDCLTTALLLMDLSLTILRCIEEKQKHDTMMILLQQELNGVNQQLKQAKSDNEIQPLTAHKKLLLERYHNAESEWTFTKIALINDLLYAATLLLAFTLLIGLVVPGGQVAAPAVILIGAIGCFALTVLFNAVNNFLPVLKGACEIRNLNRQYNNLLDDFKTAKDENKEKELYLRLMDMQAQVQYLKRQCAFQSVQGLQRLLIDSLTPVVVLLSIMAMPLGIGLATLSASFAMAVASTRLINCFQPSEAQKILYEQESFETFRQENKGAVIPSYFDGDSPTSYLPQPA